MTDQAFKQCIGYLVKQCPVAPTDEEVQLRSQELWEDLEHAPVEKLQRGIKYFIRLPEFRFFPSVGQLLDAIEKAEASSGENWLGLSPPHDGDHTIRLMNDPAYKREQKRISEESAKAYFASPEHQQLLKSMQLMAEREQGKITAELAKSLHAGTSVYNQVVPRKQRRRTKKT
jgi:hypothetical protein